MFDALGDWWQGKPCVERHWRWPDVRAGHLLKEPCCQACGTLKSLAVHHINPVHCRPDLELVNENLITLCEGKRNCHLCFGHYFNFKSWNLDVRIDVDKWHEKVKNRPM